MNDVVADWGRLDAICEKQLLQPENGRDVFGRPRSISVEMLERHNLELKKTFNVRHCLTWSEARILMNIV